MTGDLATSTLLDCQGQITHRFTLEHDGTVTVCFVLNGLSLTWLVPALVLTAITVSIGGHPGSVHANSVTMTRRSSLAPRNASVHSRILRTAAGSAFGPIPGSPLIFCSLWL